MPDFHRLNKSRTTEMNSEELKQKLREEAARSQKNAQRKKPNAQQSRKQQRISEQTKKQLPPQSPVRRQREEERRRQEKQALKERRRRKKRGSYVIYYIMLAVIAVIIFTILSITVLFNADKITIEGESDYSDEQIIEASGLHGNENLVRLNTSGIPQKILDKLVTLDSVKVDKVFPSTIKITVVRSVPMASFLYNGRNYVISHIGRVMKIDDNDSTECMHVIGYTPAESVIVGGFITAEDPEQDRLISEISAGIEKAALKDITTVDITDNIGIVLTYQDRIQISIGSVIDLDQKLKIATELIYGGYIDENERVTLDISDKSKAIQRPITNAPVTTATPETTPESYETDENGDPVISGDINSDTTAAPAA